MPRLNLCFAPYHPSTAGHFVGNPIIPGALLLAEVWAAIQAAALPQVLSASLKSAKFTHPLRPGEAYDLDFELSPSDIKFQCATTDHVVLSGVFKCLATTTSP